MVVRLRRPETAVGQLLEGEPSAWWPLEARGCELWGQRSLFFQVECFCLSVKKPGGDRGGRQLRRRARFSAQDGEATASGFPDSAWPWRVLQARAGGCRPASGLRLGLSDGGLGCWTCPTLSWFPASLGASGTKRDELV